MPKKSTGRKKSPQAKKSVVKKVVKRTVKRAAENVQSNAERARDLSAALIRAGELLGKGAVFLDLIADRAAAAPPQKAKRRGRK